MPEHDDVSVIRQWHLKRGWKDVGYHYFIQKDGTVQDGRKLEESGAHCKGENQASVGICLHGRDDFTPEQFATLRRVCNVMCGAFNIDKKDIYPHNYFNKNKTCPNFDVGKVLGD